MSEKVRYNTRQHAMLIEHLKNNPGTHFTALDVCDYFRSKGESIGLSTVYRQLEKLVNEGVIGKYSTAPGNPACFEYIGTESHERSDTCFHCKCEKCGSLIHLHCDELKEIQDHLLNEHHFKLNPMRTVFYGICEKCRYDAAFSDNPTLRESSEGGQA